MIPAAVGATLGLALAGTDFKVGASSDHSTGSSAFESKRLKPVPISQDACLYLDAVRSTSATATASISDLVLEAIGQHGKVVLTPHGLAVYRRLPGELRALDFALRVGATKVPHPISWRLTLVAADVEDGRNTFKSSPDPASYFDAEFDPLMNSVSNLADASDLVGEQCGFKLWG